MTEDIREQTAPAEVKELEQNLKREQQELFEERRSLEREKEQFEKQKHMEEQRLARESSLFEMKWKILEKEYGKLAVEKEALEQERQKYRNLQKEREYSYSSVQLQGELFFSGVDSELGMKKRYRDLIKIFHPDNRDGDKSVLQKINQEYDEMKKIF